MSVQEDDSVTYSVLYGVGCGCGVGVRSYLRKGISCGVRQSVSRDIKVGYV